MASFKIQTVDDVNDLPPDAQLCRDENCPVLQAHLAHDVHIRRGRISSSCPNCFQPVRRADRRTVVCDHCGWNRTTTR